MGYDNDLKVNSICHPNHVPNENDEFIQYFPCSHITNNKITVKYCMTSSAPLATIKAKLQPKLNEYSYFIWPTSLKTTKVTKIGWLYLAHPDLIHRSKIVKTLAPLLQSHNRQSIDFHVISPQEKLR